ncbi:MAG: hypothetical protein IJV66_03815, partial [Firmicutes bacterium]|nr:hypothetical protein [Bacillota bacterium]
TNEISKLGRAPQGVKIMRTSDDTDIISIAKMIREEDHEKYVIHAKKKKAAVKRQKLEKKKEEAEEEEKGDDSEQIKLDI